jgi:hypothetical protein
VSLILLPAVDVADRQAVRLVQGTAGSETSYLHEERQVPVVPLPLLAEVWREGTRQANLARALKATERADCTEAVAKRAGELLAATGGNNAMDAIVVATAEQRRASVVTGDPHDLGQLATHSQPRVRIVPI